jgi:hypothetical protein
VNTEFFQIELFSENYGYARSEVEEGDEGRES